VRITTLPTEMPVNSLTPVWKTSHGAAPSSASMIMEMPSPNRASPNKQRMTRSASRSRGISEMAAVAAMDPAMRRTVTSHSMAAGVGRSGAGGSSTRLRVGLENTRVPANSVTVLVHDENMLLETRCAGCDTPGQPICTTCRFALIGRAPQPQAHGVIAAVPFTGRARDVVLSLKYRNRRQVARHLGGLLVNRLVESGSQVHLDVVTWAPTSSGRRRQRGFDQAEEIARTVGRQLGVPTRRLLARSGPSTAQTGKNRAERLDGPEFVARPGLAGRNVLVVDDVVTTGATLLAARDALLQQGAHQVLLAAVASTPAAVGATVLPFRHAARAAAA
jgi:ComF family protein